jgi:serine-threonine kinase receptor-associated protein
MLRDGVSGDWIGTFEGHTGAVWSAKLNSFATRAATGSADSSAKVWNSVTGDLMATFEHKKPVRTVDFRPDSLCLATGGYEAVVRLFDLQRPDAEPRLLQMPGYTSRIKKLVWSPDGRQLYMGSDDGLLRAWDVAAGKVVREVGGLAAADPNKCGVMDMELSHDSSVLTIAVGQSVAFVNQYSLELMHSFDMGRDIETASLHPLHKRTFIAGGSDVSVRIYDVDSGAEMAEKRGHHGKVHCLRFAPGGATFSSGADDATIRLWRYEEPQRAAAAGSGATAAIKSGGAAVGAAVGAAGAMGLQLQLQSQPQPQHQQQQQQYQPLQTLQPQGGVSVGGGGGGGLQLPAQPWAAPAGGAAMWGAQPAVLGAANGLAMQSLSLSGGSSPRMSSLGRL